MPQSGDDHLPLPFCAASGSIKHGRAEVSQDTAQRAKHPQKLPAAISEEALRRLRLLSQGMLRSGLSVSPAPHPAGGGIRSVFSRRPGAPLCVPPSAFCAAPAPPRPADPARPARRGLSAWRPRPARPGPGPGPHGAHLGRTPQRPGECAPGRPRATPPRRPRGGCVCVWGGGWRLGLPLGPRALSPPTPPRPFRREP